jgi:hypothetical protein
MTNIILDYEKYNGCFFEKDINDYDYIEIGSNFWDVMSMTHKDLKGLIIEPIKQYLYKVPENLNCIKVNLAISNTNKEDGFMYYIPPNIIYENKIVDCFIGMNKLDDFHTGHKSNNLTSFVEKEKCQVITYFNLLKKYNINYVDFLKIDTEGHDCTIINNILDDLEFNSDYILPRYIYFENNGLTELDIRNNTINRLNKYGYVHIYTKDDNTLMYNCTTYHLKKIKDENIIFPKNNILNNKNNTNFFMNVHSYITYGQVDLFNNILKLDVISESEKANIIWATQNPQDNELYSKKDNYVVNIVHGGGFIYSNLLIQPKLNIMVKSFSDYNYLINNNTTNNNICFFIGKYKSQEKLVDIIFNYRQNNFNKLSSNFLLLQGVYSYNCTSIKNTYNNLKEKYNFDLYGYEKLHGEIGWADIIDNYNIDTNILSKYKFYLHLKGNGYLCNSVIFAMMCGIPVIMSRDVYIKTLYYQFIPEELIIFIDNNDIQKINEKEVIPALEYALKMSDTEYLELSKKIFLHSNFFREYYYTELNHLYYFMNNLTRN